MENEDVSEISKRALAMKKKYGEEKIYVGQKLSYCFACGEKIENDCETCPYCGIKQEKKIM